MHFWHKRKLHLDLIIYFDKQPISVTKEIQFIGAVLFLETKGWRYERRRRQASAEAPKGVGCGEGVSPSPQGKGLGRGLCPLPRKFFIFRAQNG